MIEAAGRGTAFFVDGGTLRANAPSYVQRPVDDELFELARDGEFCYVLTPRQMGKSSLMVRTARRLKAAGAATAIVDLTSIGAGVRADQWYLSLANRLCRELRLRIDLAAWWQDHAGLGDVARFTDFLRDVVLEQVAKQIVVFIDEIDTTLKLAFRDDFFAAIRATYNARATDLAFERLCFVLLGVATPNDLVQDQTRTPFNIGHGLALAGFSREDAAVLETGLDAAHPGQGAAILDRIFHWTDGHPYLTQKLCKAVVDGDNGQWNETRIDALVHELFFSEAARNESNLRFVQSRVAGSEQRGAMLKLYGQVLSGKAVPDDGQSPLHVQLKLVGLVRVEKGRLCPCNAIYRRVFSRAWIKENSPQNWRLVGAVAASVLLTAIVLGFFTLGRPFWVPRPEIAYVTVDAGEFLMGSTAQQVAETLERCKEKGILCITESYESQMPQHRVSLDGYAIGKYEVTNAQYKKCVQSTVCRKPDDVTAYDDPDHADHPVVHVTWHDARTFCEWIGGRLPTEAEWEKAARGTDGRIYPWGNEFDCKRGNFDDETELDSYLVPGGPDCDGYVRTSPVGRYPDGASPYGAMDMAGNVWEWTSSLHRLYPYDPDDGREDMEVEGERVARGGSWTNILPSVSAAHRTSKDDPVFTGPYLGFRCARSVPGD